MKCHLPALVFVLAAALAAPGLALAQEPVKSFDQLDTRLKPGDTVWVTNAQGREVKGKIRELTPSALTLDGEGGRSYQAGDVWLVVEYRGRNTAKGALWGLVAGAAGGALLGASSGNEGDYGTQSGWALAGAGIFGGIGAGAGAAIGAMSTKPGRVVYRAPGAQSASRFSIAPLITPRTKGVTVSFAF
jgi:hypothetical protein